MRILSWDIGINNLSYCLMEKDNSVSGFKIIDWDIIDVSSETKKTTGILYNIPIEFIGTTPIRSAENIIESTIIIEINFNTNDVLKTFETARSEF